MTLPPLQNTGDAVALGIALRALPDWIARMERLVVLQQRATRRARLCIGSARWDDAMRHALRSQLLRETREAATDPIPFLRLAAHRAA